MSRHAAIGSAQAVVGSIATMAVLITACGPGQAASPTIPGAASPSSSALAPRLIEAIAVDESGRVFGSDCFRNAVFRFDEAGPILVAGSGAATLSGDGGPAAEATLHCPSGLAFVGNELFIVDDGNNRIRKVAANGVITTVAESRPPGTRRGSPYEGGIQAAGLAIDESGNYYIADRDNHVVRQIGADGAITTFAGTGERGFSGDGALATSAALAIPIDVVFDDVGRLYVSDVVNDRVRMIDLEGVITTFAGTGVTEISGDGGPAQAAGFCGPTGLAIDAGGSMYVAGDCGPDGHHIRKIEEGTVSTVVGTGAKGYSGDGGPAVAAQISVPSGLAIDVEGNLYIADIGNRCIRRVDTAGIITSLWCAG